MRSPIEYEYADNELVVKIEDWLHEPLMAYMRWVPLLDALDIELDIEVPEALAWLSDLSVVKTDLIDVSLSLIAAAYILAHIMAQKTVRIVRVVLAEAHFQGSGTLSASATVK